MDLLNYEKLLDAPLAVLFSIVVAIIVIQVFRLVREMNKQHQLLAERSDERDNKAIDTITRLSENSLKGSIMMAEVLDKLNDTFGGFGEQLADIREVTDKRDTAQSNMFNEYRSDRSLLVSDLNGLKTDIVEVKGDMKRIEQSVIRIGDILIMYTNGNHQAMAQAPNPSVTATPTVAIAETVVTIEDN